MSSDAKKIAKPLPTAGRTPPPRPAGHVSAPSTSKFPPPKPFPIKPFLIEDNFLSKEDINALPEDAALIAKSTTAGEEYLVIIAGGLSYTCFKLVVNPYQIAWLNQGMSASEIAGRVMVDLDKVAMVRNFYGSAYDPIYPGTALPIAPYSPANAGKAQYIQYVLFGDHKGTINP